jgi:hypothetical protein
MALTPSQLETITKYRDQIVGHPNPNAVSEALVDFCYNILKTLPEQGDEEGGSIFNLTASYEEYNSADSDGYDDFDTYKIKLCLEDDVDNTIPITVSLNLDNSNEGKLEELLKLIDTVFQAGQANPNNMLTINAENVVTTELRV